MTEEQCPECKEGKLIEKVTGEKKFSYPEFMQDIAKRGMFIAIGEAITPNGRLYYQCSKCGYIEWQA